MTDAVEELQNWLKPLDVSSHVIESLAYQFSDTFKSLALHSTEQFLSTPLSRLPTGNERGTYVSIDLGGTNLRIGIIELLGPGQIGQIDQVGQCSPLLIEESPPSFLPHDRLRRTHEKAWPIGHHLKDNKADDLFAWIGGCIAQVVAAFTQELLLTGENVSDEVLVGIAFSFPMMYVYVVLDQSLRMQASGLLNVIGFRSRFCFLETPCW